MKKYNLDITTKTLTISADFDRQMQDPTSAEYALFMKLTADIPDLKVCRKTHKTPTAITTKSGERLNHNQFKGLTYEKMERFIRSMDNPEVYEAQYMKVKTFGGIQNNNYSMVSKWFVKQFPEYRKNPIMYVFHSPEVVKVEEVFVAEAS